MVTLKSVDKEEIYIIMVCLQTTIDYCGIAHPGDNLKSVLRGVSRIFERGGPISLGSLKKGHQILKGGGPMV